MGTEMGTGMGTGQCRTFQGVTGPWSGPMLSTHESKTWLSITEHTCHSYPKSVPGVAAGRQPRVPGIGALPSPLISSLQ